MSGDRSTTLLYSIKSEENYMSSINTRSTVTKNGLHIQGDLGKQNF